MKTNTRPSQTCHLGLGLPLFDWRPDPIRIFPDRAARVIATRYGLPLAHAAVIARLAGLGSEVR